MKELRKTEAITVAGVHTHTHTHTHSVSGYLTYKKIIEKIKTHELYRYFGIPKYVYKDMCLFNLSVKFS